MDTEHTLESFVRSYKTSNKLPPSAVSRLTKEEIRSLIEAGSVKDSVTTLLTALFAAINDEDDDENKHKTLWIYKSCISLLDEETLDPKSSSELCGVVQIQLEKASSNDLVSLSTLFMSNIRQNSISSKSLEILPTILSIVSKRSAVENGDNEFSGKEFKSYCINSICGCKWSNDMALKLGLVFREVPFTADELKMLILKFIKIFSILPLMDLPPLVYNVLSLSGDGHQKYAIDGILKFIYKLYILSENDTEVDSSMIENNNRKKGDIKEICGTILLHWHSILTQDSEFGKIFIKYLKVTCKISFLLSPFVLSCALVTAKIQRYSDQIHDLLKNTVLIVNKEALRSTQSNWLRKEVTESLGIDQIMCDFVENCKDWDQVWEELIKFGFALLDAHGPRGLGVKSLGSNHFYYSDRQKSCLAGQQLLKQFFKIQPMTRTEVFVKILDKIITRSSTSAIPYLEVLTSMVACGPQSILGALSHINEVLDHLSQLPFSTSIDIVTSIAPLMTLDFTLRDEVFIVLKKLLFNKSPECRQIGVHGLLTVVRSFKVLGDVSLSQCSQPFSLSQIDQNSQTPFNQSANENICLEALANLRRVLDQQPAVRLKLYEGTHDVIKKNPSLSNNIVAVLLNQVKKYCLMEEEEILNINFENCISTRENNCYVQEPFGQLIAALVHSCIKIEKDVNSEDFILEEDEDEQRMSQKAEDFLVIFCKKIGSMNLEDFELNSEMDFSDNSQVGKRNQMTVYLVMNTIEACLEYNISFQGYSIEASEETCNLFSLYLKLRSLLEKSTKKKGNTSIKCPITSVLSFRFIVLVTKTLFCDNDPDHQDGLKLLRTNEEFILYIVSCLVQKLSTMAVKGTCDGPDGRYENFLIKFLYKTSKFLYKIALNYADDNQMEYIDIKKMGGYAIEGLDYLFQTLSKFYPDSLNPVLTDIDKALSQRSSYKDAAINAFVGRLQKILLKLTNMDKDAVHILSIMSTLSNHLQIGCDSMNELENWLSETCKEISISAEIGFLKSLFQMAVAIKRRNSNLDSFLEEICSKLQLAFGTNEENATIDEDSQQDFYSCVNNKSGGPILNCIISELEKEIEDVKLLIASLNRQLKVEDDCDDSSSEYIEKSICGKLFRLANSLQDCMQSALPLSCIDSMIKIITEIYSTLKYFTKYFIDAHSILKYMFPNKFERLNKYLGRDFKKACYDFINYIKKSHHEKAVEKKNVDARTARQNKFIPRLILEMEQFESRLIKLDKVTKRELMSNFKISTARDFQIDTELLTNAIEAQSDRESSSEDEDVAENCTLEEESNDEEQENSDLMSPKRQKLDNTLPSRQASQVSSVSKASKASRSSKASVRSTRILKPLDKSVAARKRKLGMRLNKR